MACVHHASGPHACKDGSSPDKTGKHRSSWLTGLTTPQSGHPSRVYHRGYQAIVHVRIRSTRHRLAHAAGIITIGAATSRAPILIDARRCAKLGGTRAKRTASFERSCHCRLNRALISPWQTIAIFPRHDPRHMVALKRLLEPRL